MSIINCLDCGKLMISKYTEKLCPDCELIQKERVYIIKAYIYNNPRATRMDVYLETGIPLRIIDRLSIT
jgi:phage FluMu protein Com